MLGYAKQDAEPKHGRDARDTGRFVLVIAIASLIVGSLIVVLIRTNDRRFSTALSNPPEMADQLDFFQTAADWSAGELRDVKYDPAVARLILSDARTEFPRLGAWTSPERPAVRPFT